MLSFLPVPSLISSHKATLFVLLSRLPAIGGSGSLPGLVDVLAFAALSRGDSSQQVGDLLSAAVRSSVDAGEVAQRVARHFWGIARCEPC